MNIHSASCLTSIPTVFIINDDSKIDLTSKQDNDEKESTSIINASILSIDIKDDKQNDYQITNENVPDIPDVDIVFQPKT